MTISDDPRTWSGALVRNYQGEVLGHIDAVYLHDVTGRATWAAVTDGVGAAMVPLHHAEVDGHVVCLPYRVDQLAGAPRLARGAHLDADVEDRLNRYYGFAATGRDMASTPAGVSGQHEPAERDAGEMVLSKEQMRPGVEQRAYARVRLVTYIVTENVTFTMPVSRQEVRLEQVPLDETDQPYSEALEGELVEDVHEVVLHCEQLLFTTTTVPVERVRLVRRIVEGRQPVSVQLRSEQFDLERSPAAVDPDAETLANGISRPDR